MTDTYELLDSGDGLKLERFGRVTLCRPCAHAVWSSESGDFESRATGVFTRKRDGSGRWSFRGRVPEEWPLEFFGLRWQIRPNDHGNVGIFPEQLSNWTWIEERCRDFEDSVGEFEVLNLFGYTGGSSLAAARGRARVVHVDASKTSVQAARDNAEASGLAELPVRWIVDDAVRFVEREVRRGRKYRGLILDPPSYGRGPKGEVWQIERDMQGLVEKTLSLLDEGPAFVCLTSHSPGFSPIVLENLAAASSNATIDSGEMVLPSDGVKPLPAGAYARWSRS